MAQWHFRITPEGENDLAKLDVQVQRRVAHKLHWFIENFDHVTPVPLEERWSGFFKLRVGDWRVAYEIDTPNAEIIVHAIGRRDKIYKRKA